MVGEPRRAAMTPPSPPTSAIGQQALRRAASRRPRATLTQSPSVEMPSAMSPGRPSTRIWCANTSAMPAVLATPVTVAHVAGQRQRRQRALAHDDRMHELDRDMLRVGARAAVAEDEQGSAVLEPRGHGAAGIGDRPA